MKLKDIITTLTITIFFIFISLWCIFAEKSDYSDSERRVLAAFPEVSVDSIVSGEFAKDFEDYATERFPARDFWRSIKAYSQMDLFFKKDNNKIFLTDGHLSKLEHPINVEMINHATDLFEKIKDKYLIDNDVYLAVIPDKNRYLASDNGYLSMDYDKFSEYVKKNTEFAKYIEISDLLDASDYYYTDTHWRQEKIVDVAMHIAKEMGVDISDEYKVNDLGDIFNGVYVGQSALKCKPDNISYLTNEIIENAKTEGAKAVYELAKAEGKDPYEIFLSGNQPIVTIKNDNYEGKNKLIIFRDSFGSSIAPLFIKGYSEIVLVDLRYISSDFLGNFVDFEDADVLFMYSTLLLNNSLSMR